MVPSEFKKKCENLAIFFRQKIGLYGYDPLPANLLAKNLGIVLWRPQDLPGLDEGIIATLLDADNWWAATVPGPYPFIIYHPLQHEARYESSVMHELSHIILEHKPERLVAVAANFVGRAYPKQNEQEARYLGSCLQISKLGLDWAAERGLTLAETARHFRASQRLVQYRLNMTGRWLQDGDRS